ncbi:MAG: xanthine dehydrogenase family protein molybdopterin-binding subunit [Candidatus Eremiobacteraeota bacterium]|nr:xanthine dehydrogenase family protein molybdopterin-binding subunit [Candidatus Eremiobacteraeota bacterium]
MIESWLDFSASGVVRARTGKVELGQGILTALVQIVAEELDVAPQRVAMTSGDTRSTPDEGITSGSKSIEDGGTALRLAAAGARALFVAAARRALNLGENAELGVEDGRFVVDGVLTEVTYWSLAPAVDLTQSSADLAKPKPPASYRLVGRDFPRLDLAGKWRGGAFVHDLTVPGMLHGRIVRPPHLGARLATFDAAAATALRGVIDIVSHGSFLGLLATREEDAIDAARTIEALAQWETRPFPAEPERLVTADGAERIVVYEQGAAPSGDLRRYEGTFSRPFIAHAAIGPSCAVARWDAGRLQVWTHSQGVFRLRGALARALDVAEDDIDVIHLPGAGCYGHNGADDVALDAALLARVTRGRPVRVVWSRADELANAPFGTAMSATIGAEVDDGRIVSWKTEIRSGPHVTRPGFGGGIHLLAALELGGSREMTGDLAGGADRNAVPLYDIPHVRVEKRTVEDLPVRVSAMRSLGAFLNVFALESMVDEIALDLGRDPAEFRLTHLRDPRAKAVIERAVAMSRWAAPRSNESALGLAFARYKNAATYCAVVVEATFEPDIRVARVWAAVDAGLTINPDGLRNQIEGSIVQSLSWTLKERVRFDASGVASRTWESYPILTFAEAPEISVDILQRENEPSLGAGEAAQGPTAAAVGNAVRRGLGVRIHDLPITRERLLVTPL